MAFHRRFGFDFLAPGLTFQQRLGYFIATMGGAGYSPKAPGTVGSALALLLFYPISFTPWYTQIAATMAILAVGFFASHILEKHAGREDDQRIVIDEMAGMWITLLFFPFNPWVFGAGFLVFRILDIVKVFPADYCDQKLPGAAGVMLDDVVSGIYAQVLLRAALHLMVLL